MYKPVEIEDRHINVQPPHDCTTVKEIPLCCIDAQGKFFLMVRSCLVQ